MKRDLFPTRRQAEARAKKLKKFGCEGIHSHKIDGEFKYMPCDSHEEYEKAIKKTVKKKEKNKEEKKEEIDEFIDFDGTMTNSKIPILDPHLHPKKTTDQTVAMTRITQDPLLRGYRVYYGESTVKEEDMSDAFGYKETLFMGAEDTIKYLEKKLGLPPENAEMRADEFGKSEERDEKSEFKDEKGFVGRPILKEKMFTKEDIIKMSEDLLINKSEDNDIQKKDFNASDILMKNIKVLKAQAEAEGVSSSQLVKMLKGE